LYKANVKVKVKVNVSLFLTKYQAMKKYSGMEVQLHAFLTSALDGSDWLQPGRFPLRERASVTHWIGGWVAPRTGLDALAKGKIPYPSRDSKPGRPAH
jgi:hypothetical protein